MMRKNTVGIIATALIVLIVVAFMCGIYASSESVRSVFEGTYSASSSDVVQVAPGTEEQYMEAIEAARQNALKHGRFMGRISLAALIFVTVLQIIAFCTAFMVFSGIRKSTESVEVRMSKLENADLFLDLPLYFGLFGTVLSFSLITFNPQISRLVAYSSTLIGIIFSVILRLVRQYPRKQKLIQSADLKQTMR